MNINTLHSVYFIGIGGIGMSALAKYFRLQGMAVSGYDRGRNAMCASLEKLGLKIYYEDAIDLIPEAFLNTPKERALVIYTPAVSEKHRQLNFLKEQGFEVVKRSVALGNLVAGFKTIAVAGTHGKTTTSAMIAHLLTESGVGCNAFLGGISTNYNNNLIADTSSRYAVVEADEYDRSFLTLQPEYAVVTSIESDHLDIYGSDAELHDSFRQFAMQIKPNGKLFFKIGLPALNPTISNISYGLVSNATLRAENIRINAGVYEFDLSYGNKKVDGLKLGLPGRHNVENALAAVGVAFALEIDPEAIRSALGSFAGVKRRFEVHVTNKDRIFIDDYAHHPSEISAFVSSVREMYPKKELIGVFQPHLYSRTRDLAEDFGRALSQLDEVILLDIYPAREAPIEGVNAEMLLQHIHISRKAVWTTEALLARVREQAPEVLLTMGAGDIELLVEPLKEAMR